MQDIAKKQETSDRVLAASKKAIEVVMECVETRYEALAALQAAQAVVGIFPGANQDMDVRAL
jgi:hypothetical protein